MRTASFLALALAVGLTTADRIAVAQPKNQAKPLELYDTFRQTMSEGRFDIAGVYLDQFLKSDPTDRDFLDLQKKYGTTVFRQLKTIPKFSDDPAEEKKIRANVDELNKRADAIAAKLLYNPDRVAKYVRNLGETYEEKVYAQQELKRTGEFAVPFLVDALRTAGRDDPIALGILDTIPVLEAPTVAGWIAALDTLPPERVPSVVGAIALRRDAVELTNNAQTDFTPHLWRFLSRDPKDVSAELRRTALNLLNRLYPGLKADARNPEAELTAIARKFYDHKARYYGAKTNPDGSPSTVPMWRWNAEKLRVERVTPDVPVGQAEEYYGLMYARWALEAKPEYEPAQALILALAAERAVERARGGNLATAEPDAYRLLAAAPSGTLVDLLGRGLNEKRTPLVLATVQVLGDRGDRTAATAPPGKPSPLVRALNYPDPSVQFAAATALLRAPVAVPAEVKPRIVDVLRRAAGADPGAPGEAKGTVLLIDPVKYRADINAQLFRGLGYTVEQLATGRDLMRRIARASDFDLIFIDRHTADPELIDLVGHVDANPQAAARPVFVIASGDKPRVPTFDQLLIRVAALIAATENDLAGIPPTFVPDPRAPREEQIAARDKRQQERDTVFATAVAARVARLQRVIDNLPLNLSDPQRRLLAIRTQQISYALLAAEFPLTEESAPRTVQDVARLARQAATQPPSGPYGAGAASTELIKLIERLELDVAKVPAAAARYDALRSRVDPVDLGIPVETYRDPVLEAKLARTLKGYPAVKVVAEPYSRIGLETELRLVYADPMMIPRDGAAKKGDARAAVEFLRQMAVGDLPGYDLKTAEPVLVAALQVPDLAPAAVDAVERFKTGGAQLALINLALSGDGVPVAVRIKAADAAIRHIGANGSAVPATIAGPVGEQSKTEKSLELRSKLLAIHRLAAGPKSSDLTEQLKAYSPPLQPPEPKKEPAPAPAEPKKDPEPKP